MKVDSQLDDSPQAQLALRFVCCLVAGDFDTAHQMLSAELQAILPPSELSAHYTSTTSYWDCDVEVVRLLGASNALPPPTAPEVFGWIVPPGPDTGEHDVGVSVESDPEGLVEFICVRIAPEDGRLVIRDILWGRP